MPVVPKKPVLKKQKETFKQIPKKLNLHENYPKTVPFEEKLLICPIHENFGWRYKKIAEKNMLGD